MTRFTFDVSLFAHMTVESATEIDARKHLYEALNRGGDIVLLGRDSKKGPFCRSWEADEGEADLVEIDGEPV